MVTALGLVAWLFTGCSAALPANPDRGFLGEAEAVVRTVAAEGERPFPGSSSPRRFQRLDLELLSGPNRGQMVNAEAQFEAASPVRFSVGDHVLLEQVGSVQGQGGVSWVVADSVRLPTLQWLAALFVLLVVWVGRRRGVTSVLGLVISFVVVTQGMLPLLAAGAPPIVVGVAASCVILLLTLYLAHGINRQTSVAVVGTAVTLIISGVLALLVVDMTKLTGISQEGLYLQSALPGTQVNLVGLLQAGILIAMLGVLDDITIGQSAVVFALRAANPALGVVNLYQRGMQVGREHIASLVNTLVLVYAGASLPLLLYLTVSGVPIGAALNREIVATEVVRTLVGSLALVVAVPLTTALGAWVVARSPAATGDNVGPSHQHQH